MQITKYNLLVTIFKKRKVEQYLKNTISAHNIQK